MLVKLACCLPGATLFRHYVAVAVVRKHRRQFIVDEDHDVHGRPHQREAGPGDRIGGQGGAGGQTGRPGSAARSENRPRLTPKPAISIALAHRLPVELSGTPSEASYAHFQADLRRKKRNREKTRIRLLRRAKGWQVGENYPQFSGRLNKPRSIPRRSGRPGKPGLAQGPGSGRTDLRRLTPSEETLLVEEELQNIGRPGSAQ